MLYEINSQHPIGGIFILYTQGVVALGSRLGWYYDLFDTLLRNPQIAGDFGDIACDFGEDHNELFKSEVISIFKSQVISILARVRM